ncbi:MAG: DUF1080 domain-containing protein [Planctomycetia bacterium]|nr:DUF1080 domain-containing protein [Planctomycetia bacterium]
MKKFAAMLFFFLLFLLPSLVKAEDPGFTPLFNGKDLSGWVGAVKLYEVLPDGVLSFVEGKKNYGNLMYNKKFSDFILRFEFKLVPNGNNGLGIRATAIDKDAAYEGMELQILDDTGDLKQHLKPYQYHGSIYGAVAAKKGFLKPVGEWNAQEVQAVGSKIKVILNGTVILDTDIAGITTTPDGKDHPGLHNKEGYIGFLGHTMPVQFRNIRIKELK